MLDYEIKKKKLPSKKELEKLKSFYSKGRLSDTVATLLLQRGLDTKSKIRKFFLPSLTDLYDPFLMLDMHKAVKRIYNAVVLNNEKVLFYGDYDVDGVTSVVLAYNFFSGIYGKSNFDWYIPDRFDEGYGMSIKGIDYAKKNGCSLIITFDCGINAIEQVKYANSKGIDVIITDHHNPQASLPEAFAIVNPKRDGDNYPYKELSGCAVAFKLLQGYCEIANIGFSNLYNYIDLVALSIAADIVPITDENRIFCQFGLDKLNNNPVRGLRELVKISGFKDKEITVEKIVFGLAPRINVAGRLKHAKIVVNLLLTGKKEFAFILDELNEERKSIENKVVETIIERYETKNANFNTIVAYGDGWNKGVLGIVASKVVEQFYKPTIVFTFDGEKITGSGRTVPEFNIFEAVKQCSHCLEKFGGHNFAVGLVLKDGCLEEFSKCLEEVASKIFENQRPVPKMYFDVEVKDFSELNYNLYNTIKRFAPFGPGNPKPLFYVRNVKVHGSYSRIVGTNLNHLKLFVLDKNRFGMGGIAFKQADKFEKIINNEIGICFYLEENVYKEKHSLQLNVKQIEV